MEPREPDLEKLGKLLRETLAHHGSEQEEMRRARSTFLLDFATRHAHAKPFRPHFRSRGSWRYALVATLGAAAAGIWAGVWLWPRTVSFQVGEARPGRIGDMIEALEGRPTPLQFSEGSRLLLHEGGRMRILSLEPQAARVLVEDGILDVNVVPTKARKTRWDFEAGPYRVKVTGTKFRMAFTSRDRSFSLSTQEGQVVVSGGCQQKSQKVFAGESIRWTCPARQEEALPNENQNNGSAASAPAEDPRPEPPAPIPPSSLSTHGDPAWRDLLRAGQLADGLASAKRYGFQRACRLATSKELLALGDAARLFGSPADAVAPLRILRQRFATSTDAATAAFRLGLVAFEREHDYPEASRWFETYLRDQPTGPLMGDAFGRLMQARSRAGDMQRAREDAQQYLRRFPEGPYASEARGILSK